MDAMDLSTKKEEDKAFKSIIVKWSGKEFVIKITNFSVFHKMCFFAISATFLL